MKQWKTIDDDGFLYYLGPDEEEDIPSTIKSYNSFGMDVIRPTIEHLTSLLEEHGIGLKFVTVWVATSVTHGHTERFDILPTDNILSRQVQLQYYKKDFPSDTKRTFIYIK